MRPGTDGAIAMAMLNVIIAEDLYDHDFVEKWTFGFDALVERVKECTPAWAAEISWVPEEKIVAAARMFANAERGAVQWGLAVDQTKYSFGTAHAINAIIAITGNVDKPGTMTPITSPYGLDKRGSEDFGMIPAEKQPRRIGWNEYPLIKAGIPMAHPDVADKQFETGYPYPIKAAWLQTTNTIACMGTQPQRQHEQLKGLDFVAALDVFMRDQNTQLLCPSHKGKAGIQSMNKEIQSRVNPRKPGEQAVRFGSTEFRIRDRVIMTQNNYEAGYFNGDMGVIKQISASTVTVMLENKEITVKKHELGDMALSYCISIHKSQGSEFENVCIVLPENPQNAAYAIYRKFLEMRGIQL